MRLAQAARHIVLVALVASVVAVEPHAAGQALGQEVPQQICGAQASDAPQAIGQPDANGWTSDQEALSNGGEVRRYRFSVKEKGTAYVYIGDQWYDLNLGLFSMKANTDVGCWAVQVR